MMHRRHRTDFPASGETITPAGFVVLQPHRTAGTGSAKGMRIADMLFQRHSDLSWAHDDRAASLSHCVGLRRL